MSYSGGPCGFIRVAELVFTSVATSRRFVQPAVFSLVQFYLLIMGGYRESSPFVVSNRRSDIRAFLIPSHGLLLRPMAQKFRSIPARPLPKYNRRTLLRPAFYFGVVTGNRTRISSSTNWSNNRYTITTIYFQG